MFKATPTGKRTSRGRESSTRLLGGAQLSSVEQPALRVLRVLPEGASLKSSVRKPFSRFHCALGRENWTFKRGFAWNLANKRALGL